MEERETSLPLQRGVRMTKLLIQADDYGITRAAAQGILHGIREGVVRNTGLFANMPWTDECVEWIRPYTDRIGFGIDLNASTGSSLLGHEKLPVLTHEDGSFLTSRENRALDTDENNHDHLNYDEVYAEFDAQIQKYIELMGKKPDYIHNHAYGTKTTMQVTRDLVEKYNVPYSVEFQDRPSTAACDMSWYGFGSAEDQLKGRLKEYLLTDEAGFLKKEYGFLVTHCGYCDAELFRLSSFNACRMADLDALTSSDVKQWIRDNHIELITYKDIPR